MNRQNYAPCQYMQSRLSPGSEEARLYEQGGWVGKQKLYYTSATLKKLRRDTNVDTHTCAIAMLFYSSQIVKAIYGS
jgi:hypothetical protein